MWAVNADDAGVGCSNMLYDVAMLRRLMPVGVLVAAACCSKSDVKSGGSGSSPPPPTAPGKPTFTMFALAEVRGQIGPCGCTSDPLGDLSRTVELVETARKDGPTLVVDAGSLLYAKSPVPPQLEAQENLKADLLATTYKTDLQVAALGLGPADLVEGPDKTRLPRSIANLSDDPKIAIVPPHVIDDPTRTGGAKVGVFGVAMPDMLDGLAATSPVEAGKRAVAELDKQGAQVIVGLIQARSKKDAVQLMRDIGGIDLAIAGLGAVAPEPERVEPSPQKVGDGWLIVPANRGQVVSRLDVTVRGKGHLADAIGEAAAKTKIEKLEHRKKSLADDIAKMSADPAADKSYIATLKNELADVTRQHDALTLRPTVVPATGSYFTLAQVRIAKTLACAKPIDERVTAFYRAAGEANVKAAAGDKPKPPAKGKPGYAGGESCSDCHDEAAEFWKKTRHAHAWQTLVDRGQQFDLDCINCHVTGWQEPGGSTLAFNDSLRDVQCEVCHGPSSIHVAKGGDEKPAATVLAPPEDLCATKCHTHEHSDTFDRTAYLRDILGPGHGEKARKKLGDGPTGAQLRKAALDKAGRELGAGCSR